MKTFEIYAGLGGGFGGAILIETSEFKNEEEAYDFAYQMAIQEYETYAGLHGLKDYDEILEEYDGDETAADYEYQNEMDIWLDYYVVEV